MNNKQKGRARFYPTFSLLVALLALVGCTTTLPAVVTPTPSVASTTPANEGDPLANTSWQLTALGDSNAPTPVIDASMITLAFSADQQAGGNGGCNSYGGNYTVTGETISFGEIVSTLMACADQPVMSQEGQYLEALNNAERFALDDDQLTIWYNDGVGMLTFTEE